MGQAVSRAGTHKGVKLGRLVPWVGALVAIAMLALLVRRLDWRLFADTLAGARAAFVIAIFLAIVLGQLLSAWKWQQIVNGLQPVPVWRLFEATMAGYLANMLAPLGLSPFVRSWLVARRSGLKMSGVLATVAVDRLVDGLVFAGFVLAIAAGILIPDPDGRIRLGLVVASLASTALIALLLTLLWRHKKEAPSEAGFARRLIERLPERMHGPAQRLVVSFAEGTLWPGEPWRRWLVIALSLTVKLVAPSHLALAGLAFNVDLAPTVYLVVVALLGFIVVLTHVARIPAGFVLGGVFTLGLFGVREETALAMVTLVMVANIAAVFLFGLLGLWRQGLTLRDVSTYRIKTDAGL